MHISELVLPEWVRLRTFLKGIVTVTHSLILGTYPLSYTLFLSLPPPGEEWIQGLLHAEAPQCLPENPFAALKGLVLVQKAALCFHILFSLLLTGHYITPHERGVSE